MSLSSPLAVRRVDIDFAGVPLSWHPARPGLARAANLVSFAAVTFERRLCDTFREALASTDALPLDLRAECEDFIAQEATHSRLHRRHLAALGGTASLDVAVLQGELDALADAHLGGLSLLDRLALGAIVEGALAPLGHYLVGERDVLFAGGDVRVAALFLWHFSEEIEHRSTAHALYRAVGGTWAHRLRQLPRLWRLHRAGMVLLSPHLAAAGQPHARLGLPRSAARRRLLRDLAASLGPRPPMRPLPGWAARYLHAIQRGIGPVEAWTGQGRTAAGGEAAPRSRAIAV